MRIWVLPQSVWINPQKKKFQNWENTTRVLIVYLIASLQNCRKCESWFVRLRREKNRSGVRRGFNHLPRQRAGGSFGGCPSLWLCNGKIMNKKIVQRFLQNLKKQRNSWRGGALSRQNQRQRLKPQQACLHLLRQRLKRHTTRCLDKKREGNR